MSMPTHFFNFLMGFLVRCTLSSRQTTKIL